MHANTHSGLSLPDAGVTGDRAKCHWLNSSVIPADDFLKTTIAVLVIGAGLILIGANGFIDMIIGFAIVVIQELPEDVKKQQPVNVILGVAIALAIGLYLTKWLNLIDNIRTDALMYYLFNIGGLLVAG